MTAQIIAWPVSPRPIPVEHHPLYRLGVEHFLEAILRERGMDPASVKEEARRLTAMTWRRFDDPTRAL